MKTPLNPCESIWEQLSSRPDSAGRFLSGAAAGVCIDDLLQGTSLGGRLTELLDRSVLLSTQDQLVAALALMELDGVARRVIICPPDVSTEQFPSLIAKGGVDLIVSDYELNDSRWIPCSTDIQPVSSRRRGHRPTEWILLTSGTTGTPKMIVHTLASLTAPIDLNNDTMRDNGIVWGTFYDIRRYGGLQIFLRATLGRGSMVLSSAGESMADHLARLDSRGVTHLSGTPSHWRRALMSPHAHRIAPRYVRLSGEIVDQPILNALQAFYPNSAVGHAFASTEAGVAFEVNDGLAGFPAVLLGKQGEVEMKLGDDSLQIRSNRTASRYLDTDSGVLADEHGFVDTGDVVELRGDRCYFLGRRNGVINVGGLKVYPEEIEAVINRHPAVRMSMVRPRRNPFTGALVSADVVLKELLEPAVNLTSEILEICRQNLPPHKIPATIRCVSTLQVAAAGKLVRRHA